MDDSLALVVDLLVVALLIGALVAGLRRGLWQTLGSIIGFVAGCVALYFAIPLLSAWVLEPWLRVFAVIAATALLPTLGAFVGRAITGGGRPENAPHWPSRLVGGATASPPPAFPYSRRRSPPRACCGDSTRSYRPRSPPGWRSCARS